MTTARKLGRIRPRILSRRFRLGAAAMDRLPDPPDNSDYSAAAAAWLHQPLKNDELADCTAAGLFHIGGAWHANNGAAVPYSEADCVRFYALSTGYRPGHPETDRGGSEVDVLNFAMQKGLCPGQSNPHTISSWVTINAADPIKVKKAIWLFGGLYVGMSMPDAWIVPEAAQSDGFVFDVAGPPNDDNGHCMAIVGYHTMASGALRLKLSTWGMIGEMTGSALAKYGVNYAAGECYAIFGRDWISAVKKKAPNDFDAEQLASDIANMRT